jgi:hypothetical protein
MKYIDAADSSTVKSTTTNNLFSFFNFFKKSTTTDNFIINISTTTPFVKDIYTSGLKVLSSTTVKLNTEKTVISKLNSEICDSSSFSIIKIGANGSKVKELQSFLIRDKYLLIDTPTEYFGLKTQGAVKAFQLKNNVAPALGNFGEITKKVYCELIKTVN